MESTFEREGYKKIDVSKINNPYLCEIGDYIFERENYGFKHEFKSKDILILRNRLKADSSFEEDAFNRFYSSIDYAFFLQTARPYNKLPSVNISPSYSLIGGAFINIDRIIDFMTNLLNITSSRYQIFQDNKRYLNILDKFKFGEEALIDAGIKVK